MYTYPCVCGKNTMNFKFDIGGPFTGECCALVALEESIKAQIAETSDGTSKTDDKDIED